MKNYIIAQEMHKKHMDLLNGMKEKNVSDNVLENIPDNVSQNLTEIEQ